MALKIIQVADKPTLDTVKTNTESIETKIDTLDTVADTINSKAGATSDTGGTSSAGTIMAKLNKIISDIATHVASWTSTRAGYVDNIRSYTATNNTASTTGTLSQKLSSIISTLSSGVTAKAVKSVQRGTTVLNKSTPSATITISSIDANKSMVLLDGSVLNSGDETNNAYLTSLTDTSFGIQVLGSTTASTTGVISWQVIEFY